MTDVIQTRTCLLKPLVCAEFPTATSTITIEQKQHYSETMTFVTLNIVPHLIPSLLCGFIITLHIEVCFHKLKF